MCTVHKLFCFSTDVLFSTPLGGQNSKTTTSHLLALRNLNMNEVKIVAISIESNNAMRNATSAMVVIHSPDVTDGDKVRCSF